jgi:predicted ArsR family transcriptional regulator
MLVTCKQFAKTFGVSYLQASSMIKVLVKTGVATEASTIKQPGRGRPTSQYNIPSSVTINMKTGKAMEDSNG